MEQIISKAKQIILFLILAIFPFGQLISFTFKGQTFKGIDLLVGFFAVLVIFESGKPPKIFWKLGSFCAASFFSLLLTGFDLRAFLYLIRFLAYALIFIGVVRMVKQDRKWKSLILNSLLLVGIISGVFGWIQYLLYPDLRALYFLGWDDHLFRLTGTFLDPGFMGIVLVLSAILSLFLFFEKKRKRYFFSLLFLVFTLLFTYSRASYLALFIGVFVLLAMYKRLKMFLFVIVGFLIAIPFLPRPASSGVELERLYSVVLRVENYRDGYQIFRKYPLFGVGYNNICYFKDKPDVSSHSCFGLDNSFLLILATTGIVGFLLFADFIFSLPRGKLLLSTGVAVIVHSFSANTLFYPFVMFWMFVLIGIVVRENK